MMKRTVAVILLLCMVIMSIPAALAYDENTAGVKNMPAEVKRIIEDKWPQWRVTGWVNPAGIKRTTACAFAALRKDGQNLLVAFSMNDLSERKWRVSWSNSSALPQGNFDIVLAEASEGGTEHGRFASYYVYDGEIQECYCLWAHQDDNTWRLQQVCLYQVYPLMFFDTHIPGKMHVYNTGWVDQETSEWLSGTYQTDLRYFSYEAFPKSLQEARQKLTNAPAIPSGTLQPVEVTFKGGQKYDVYSAPGTASVRAANGKAKVSTNSWIQVFGRENGMVLVQYSIDKPHYRFGYIDEASLPANANVPDLAFDAVPATLTEATSLTDDPLYSCATLGDRLPESTNVYWLATMGTWAYVEVSNGNGWMRGFVPASFLTVSVPQTYTTQTINGNEYDLFEVRKFIVDENNRVTAVEGNFARAAEDDECYYRESADNTYTWYPLAGNAAIVMPAFDQDDDEWVNIPPEDLVQWYIDNYLNGETLEGGLIYQVDVMNDAPMTDTEPDYNFWFVTTHILLNDQNEIVYMEYAYVPWG